MSYYPLKNQFVLYFDNKESSSPIHMININIILITKCKGITSFFFFQSQSRRSVSVAVQQIRGFWYYYLLSEECNLFSIVYCFKLLFWKFTISSHFHSNTNTYLQKVLFIWEVSAKGIIEKKIHSKQLTFNTF